jgi:hypothetical protein
VIACFGVSPIATSEEPFRRPLWTVPTFRGCALRPWLSEIRRPSHDRERCAVRSAYRQGVPWIEPDPWLTKAGLV